MFEATATMRPSRIDTSPSTMSKRSFIVRTIPLRISSDDIELQTSDFRLQTSNFRLAELRRRPLHLGRMCLAVLHRDQLCENADRDLLRRDGADVEADRRVDPFEQLGRHPGLGQRVVD